MTGIIKDAGMGGLGVLHVQSCFSFGCAWGGFALEVVLFQESNDPGIRFAGASCRADAAGTGWRAWARDLNSCEALAPSCGGFETRRVTSTSLLG